MITSRRTLLAAAAGSLAAPAIARAQSGLKWRCVTSWTRNLPGPGVSARRLAERITAMSAGALTVEVFAAGEITGAFQVLDAVSTGAVEMGHTASIFWGGKAQVAPLFTTVPFGPGPTEHMAWLQSGGQELWDELYASFSVKPFVGGNTGPSAAGWFRREIRSAADIKGLRIRATGIGGEVYSALGATAIAVPPGDTYAALERGVIDAVELLAPANDAPLGLFRIAQLYAFPSFNKPNGASELIIGLERWNALPADLKAVIEAATRAEHDVALAECETTNAAAIARLVASGTRLLWLPEDVIASARTASRPILERIAASSPLARRIVDHLEAHRAAGQTWRQISAASLARLT